MGRPNPYRHPLGRSCRKLAPLAASADKYWENP